MLEVNCSNSGPINILYISWCLLRLHLTTVIAINCRSLGGSLISRYQTRSTKTLRRSKIIMIRSGGSRAFVRRTVSLSTPFTETPLHSCCNTREVTISASPSVTLTLQCTKVQLHFICSSTAFQFPSQGIRWNRKPKVLHFPGVTT